MSDQVPEGTTASELKHADEKTPVEASPLAEALQVLAEKGVIQRNQAADILENHSWLVSVGELPELVSGKLHQHMVPAPDETGSNVAGISARQTPEFVPESPASLGSWGELNGTLTVDRGTAPDEEVRELGDEDVTLVDDEPTTVGTGKKKRK